MHEWNLADPFLNTWVLMNQAHDASSKVTDLELSQQNSTFTQLIFLMLLDASNVPLTPGEIALFVFREQHSASAQLSRMQTAGLVEKVRSEIDQRVVHIGITRKGKAHLDQVKSDALGCACSMLEDVFTEDEVREFEAYLKRLRDCALERLGKHIEPLPAIFHI